jgi:hypothetical protein
MMSTVKVLGGMLVLRRVAASHMSARQAQAQMYPPVPQLNAFLAYVVLSISDFDLVEMGASIFHGCLLAISGSRSSDPGHVTKGHHHDITSSLSLRMVLEVFLTCFVLIIFLAF